MAIGGSKIVELLGRFAAVADAYDANELEDPRPEWGSGLERDRKITIMSNRGGRGLLVLGDFLDARDLLLMLVRDMKTKEDNLRTYLEDYVRTIEKRPSDIERLAILKDAFAGGGGDVSCPDPPKWTLSSLSTRLWSEDDATVSHPDHERLEDAWKRLFPESPTPVQSWDGGDSIFRLYLGGLVVMESYPGNSEIRRLRPEHVKVFVSSLYGKFDVNPELQRWLEILNK
jgi:hypothetical protein